MCVCVRVCVCVCVRALCLYSQIRASLTHRTEQFCTTLTQGGPLPEDAALFQDIPTPLTSPHAQAPEVATIPAAHPVTAAANVYEPGTPFRVPVLGPDDPRPCGLVPEAAFQAPSLVAELHPAPEDPEVAEAMQQSAQTEIDTEISKVRMHEVVCNSARCVSYPALSTARSMRVCPCSATQLDYVRHGLVLRALAPRRLARTETSGAIAGVTWCWQQRS